MELNDLLLFACLNTVFICIVSVIVALVLRWIMDFNLMKRLESCEMSVKGFKSSGARTERSARMNEAVLRAAELYKASQGLDGSAKPDLLKVVGQVAMEYPDIALQVPGELAKWAKKMGIDEQVS